MSRSVAEGHLSRCPDRRRSLKEIAGPAHRFQMDGVFRVDFDFFPQPPDVYVHAARRDEAFRAPDRVEELVAGEDAVGPRRQVIEQAKLERAERQRSLYLRWLTRYEDGSITNLPISIVRSTSPAGSARRKSALTRATSSRGLKGLVT